MKLHDLETAMSKPVLILAYNRPDFLRHLIKTLKPMKPESIFVSIDGPPSSTDVSVQRCYDVLDEVSGDISVFVRPTTEHLGCGKGVLAGLQWFFSEAHAGYILEDDVLPTSDFFRFCSTYLDLHQDDPRVISISGVSLTPTQLLTRQDEPRLSRFVNIWGWAGWPRSVDGLTLRPSYTRTLYDLLRLRTAESLTAGELAYWLNLVKAIRQGYLDTWDVQLQLLALRRGQFSIAPPNSLSDNLGFGHHATHTQEAPPWLTRSSSLAVDFRASSPRRDRCADAWESSNIRTLRLQSGLAKLFARFRYRGSEHRRD